MPPVPCSDQPALRKPAAHQSPRLAFSPQRQEGISPVRTEVRVGCVLQDTCRAVSAALGISGLPQIGQSGLVRRPPGLRRNVTRAKTRSRRVGVDQRHQRARFCKRAAPPRAAASPLRVLRPGSALFVEALPVPSRVVGAGCRRSKANSAWDGGKDRRETQGRPRNSRDRRLALAKQSVSQPMALLGP